MILKIRKNHLYINAGWHIVSGISGIDYSHVMTGILTSEDIKDSWFTERLSADEEEGKGACKHYYFPPDNKSGEWIRVMVKFTDGREQEWIVQAETYLLNDEGKTIERIF